MYLRLKIFTGALLLNVLGFITTIHNLMGQCSNFIVENYDSFEYSEDCPFIIPNTTFQTSPQLNPNFGPSRTGLRHLYLNFIDNYLGEAFDRPYTVCQGGTYRISFYHRDAWGGNNNNTFAIYDENNVLLHSSTVSWSGQNWNHWVSPEITATTNTLRLSISNNLWDGSNNDLIIDDMTLELCSFQENKNYYICQSTAPLNLFSLFSSAMPTDGVWTGPSTLTNGHMGTFNTTNNILGTYTYSLPNQSTCANNPSTITISNSPVVNLGPDIYHCTAQNVTLDAGPDYDFYLWSNNLTTQQITVNTSGQYIVKAGKLGTNLIANGDFNGGSTAAANNFTSQYSPGSGGSYGTLSNPGQFAIASNPSLTHYNFSNCQDHTGNNGNMFIANGANYANTLVWSQTINVEPNTDYLFSYWAMNVVNDPNTSSLQLFINGQPIGGVNNTTTNPCNWLQVNDEWNSGTSTTAILSIYNQSTSEGGNDFAIDDISFSPYCYSTDTINVTIDNHTLQFNNNQTICVGSNVTLTANASSPQNSNYTYYWSNNNINTNTQQVSPEVTTTYTVYAINEDGCTTPTRTSTITVIPRPEPNAGMDTTICVGTTILLNASVSNNSNMRNWTFLNSNSNPSGIATFAPTNTALNPTVSFTQTGTYQLILTELNNTCGSVKDTVQVIVSEATHTTISNDPTCNGGTDGSITINNEDAIKYSFDNANSWGNNPTVNNLSAGQHIIWSENQFGCRFSSTVTLNQPPPLLFTISADTSICQNGTAALKAYHDESQNLNYHWISFPSEVNPTIYVNPQETTQYGIYCTDANGCMTDTLFTTVQVKNSLTAQLTQPFSTCPNTFNQITVNNIAGGISDYTIEWSNGFVEESSQSSTININSIDDSIIFVKISDACESDTLILTTIITVNEVPIPSIQTLVTEKCELASFEINNATEVGTFLSNKWILSNGEEAENRETFVTTTLPAGTYNLTYITTSPEGCSDTTVYPNLITVHPKPIADFRWNPSPIRMFDTKTNLTSLSTNAHYYNWTIEDGTPYTSSQENPQVFFPEGITGSYRVILAIESQYGCRDTTEKIIEVLPDILIFAPNSFTPDGDEFNQKWKCAISGIDPYNFTLEIYNRWGQRIWESHDPDEGWDGTYNGIVVQDGTYSWLIRAKDRLNDNIHVWNGHLNLIK